ncbi:hypothetical protein, partial [Enterobacter cloacae]
IWKQGCRSRQLPESWQLSQLPGHCPKEGRRTLALNAGLLAKQMGEPRLEVLSMDVLMACDKAEVREVLAQITDILQGQA